MEHNNHSVIKGLYETDSKSPDRAFTNVRIKLIHRVSYLHKQKPLFLQIQKEALKYQYVFGYFNASESTYSHIFVISSFCKKDLITTGRFSYSNTDSYKALQIYTNYHIKIQLLTIK